MPFEVFSVVHLSPNCPLNVGDLVRVDMKHANGWWLCTARNGLQGNVHSSCLAPVHVPAVPQQMARTAAITDAPAPLDTSRPLIILDVIFYFAVHFLFSICMLALAVAATAGNGMVVWAHLHQVPFLIAIFVYYYRKNQLSVHYQEAAAPPPKISDERPWIVRLCAWCGKCHLTVLVGMIYAAYYGAAIVLHFIAMDDVYDEENLKVWWFLIALAVLAEQFTIISHKSILIVQVCLLINTYDISFAKHTLVHRWGVASETSASMTENSAPNGMLRTGVNYWSLIFKLAWMIAAAVLFQLDI
jgi:hypothetical protein